MSNIGFPDFSKLFGTPKTQPADAEEARLKREAELAVEKLGHGECAWCHQEIFKNEVLEMWEDEVLICYCPTSKDHKHHPKIQWKSANEPI